LATSLGVVPAVNHLFFPLPSLPFLFLARAKAPAQTKIYVGNVEPHITTEMIKTVFEPFGMVVGAEMVVDPNNPGLSSVELRRAQGDETAVDVVFTPAPTMLGWVGCETCPQLLLFLLAVVVPPSRLSF